MKNVRLFISVLSVLSVVFCRADVVDVNQARANALQFINSGPRKSRARYTHRPSELRLMHTRINPIDKKPLFYLFNREQNGGFILASADDATKPVLAYSYEGKINPDSLPCCAKYWFDMYAQQIAQVRENPALIRHARAMDLQPTIAPLVHCCWNQGSTFANDSYNSLCPINPETGGRCVTGCVATAIGQIMYYHKWPERGTGSHSYNWKGKTLSANFGETTYDWCSMMRGEIDAPNSISTLLYHVGVAIDMNYRTDGSGASISEATRLTDYFGYADNIQLMRRSKVSTSEWETTIYQELSNGRPVLYSGFPQQGDGHAFVCDGYENGYFHLNLGWGGIGNGFFDLDFIAEKDLFDFSYNQWICYGIAPPEGASAIETYMLDDVKYVLDKKINKAVCCGGNVTGEVSILPSVEINGRSYSVSTIESYAYSNCKGLTSITIPSSVTGIGVDAFTGCDNLTSVTLNSNDLVSQTMFLRQIFGSQVKEYIIGDNVTTIGEYAFEGCSNLISITIPENVTSIESMAFSNCSDLISVTINSNAIASKSDESSPTLSEIFGSQVKKYVFGNGVESIGSYACCDCTNMTSVTIPNSVTSIGDYAFSYCSGLTSVTIPNSVSSIGSEAFRDCSGLTKAEFASVESLCNINFVGYNSNPLNCAHHLYINGEEVKDLVIPNSVTSIGDYAFRGCNGLTSVTIPNSVTSIGDYAFRGCNGLTSVTIPNSVTSIGGSAFYGCSGLTSVTIPNSVNEIGNSTFYGCSSLSRVELNSDAIVSKAYSSSSSLSNIFGSQVTEYILSDDVKGVGDYAFYECRGLTSISIPDGVASIGNSAFSGCTGLTSINIPDGVMSIGNSTFYNCRSLTSISIPNSVNSIGSSAFSDCNRLISVTLNSNAIVAKDLNIFDNMFGSQVKEYILGDQITKIGTANFCNCKNLSSITIPESVTSIGDIAFGDCSALTSITIPKSVKSIGNNAFSGCSSLTLVTINSNDLLSKTNYSSNLVKIFGSQVQEFILGDYITDIGDYAFYGYNNLKSITIPDAVTTIGNFAFNDCSSLAYIHIPEHITTIGNYAFSRCIGLTSIKIPAHVGNFGDKPFEGCDNLESVTINSNTIVSKDYPAWSSISTLFGEQVKEYVLGNEVTAIGDNAFRDCRNLTSITIPKSVSLIGESAFEECSCLSSINIPEGVTSIGGCAFFNCSNLGSVTIPISVRSIGDNSFYGCTSLTSISIPEGVETIGESTFGECSSLISVAIPESVTTIGWGAFRGCSSLSSVTIPEGITTIEDYTFAGCKKLSSIIIPPKVERIGWDAFAECGSLAEIFCYAVTPPSSSNEAFEGDNLNTVTLYVPLESLKKYQTTSPWNEFGTIRAIGMFKVSYFVDGEAYQTVWLPEGETIIPATNPTKQGYTFSGWSEVPEKMPAHDVEVTGSYSINSYTLTYKVDGEEYKTSTVVYGAELTAETEPTKEGYTFCGWSEIPEKMPAHDVEVTGSFSINSYTLTYKVDGEEYKTSTIVYGAELTAETEPTKEGYTFSGWSEIPEKMPAHDVEVTGSFSVNKYEVTFKYGEEVLSTATVNYGEEIPLPESLDSDRYTLVEWLDVPATMPAHDITIQANFTDGVSSIGMGQQTKEPQYYDVSGRKLTRPSKGITIVNGKKVLVK